MFFVNLNTTEVDEGPPMSQGKLFREIWMMAMDKKEER